MKTMSARERQLVQIARDAQRWFRWHVEGKGAMGAHDDLRIGRELVRVLTLYQDVEPTADVDRRALSQADGFSEEHEAHR